MGIFRHPATIVVLVLLVVLLFGSKRLPDMARSVGQSLKIFKKEVKELHADDDEVTTSTTTTTTTTPVPPQPGVTTSTPTSSTNVAGGTPGAQDDAPKA